MSVVNAGTSVFALKYKDGIMFAADTSITYDSMMKHKKAQRISPVGEESLFACSGEMADFQNLKKMLAEKYEEDLCENDGACFLHPKDYFNWVARMQYQKRLKSDPIMVTALFGGIHNKTKEPFLGSTNFHGTKVEADYLLTGLAMHYCTPLFTNRWSADMSEADARKLIEDCMRLLFFRDKKGHDEIQIGKITYTGGVVVEDSYKIEASSDLQFFYNRTNEFWRPMRKEIYD